MNRIRWLVYNLAEQVQPFIIVIEVTIIMLLVGLAIIYCQHEKKVA